MSDRPANSVRAVTALAVSEIIAMWSEDGNHGPVVVLELARDAHPPVVINKLLRRLHLEASDVGDVPLGTETIKVRPTALVRSEAR